MSVTPYVDLEPPSYSPEQEQQPPSGLASVIRKAASCFCGCLKDCFSGIHGFYFDAQGHLYRRRSLYTLGVLGAVTGGVEVVLGKPEVAIAVFSASAIINVAALASPLIRNVPGFLQEGLLIPMNNEPAENEE